jgi:lipopolysaccharide transport system ATP-binding protein
MSDVAIRVEGLGKMYRIGGPADAYGTLRDTLVSAATYPYRVLRGGGYGADTHEFWALRDVSFEVEHGEVLGIIGRNGAGKSTLLKILSRITEPTTGRAVIHGRVGALLEVGTGFHPELSGRENVYLNGAVLGMRKAEIDRQFDAIVDFAGVEEFLDTPVKRYSSGMRVRLAFAVAAHLEPEILIVDEVLAVGDAEFQQKCLGRMSDVSHAGKTVLFVSHNLFAITEHCSRVVTLTDGSMSADGDPQYVVSQYRQQVRHIAGQPLDHRKDRKGDGSVRAEQIWVTDESETPVSQLSTGGSYNLNVKFSSSASYQRIRMVIAIFSDSNQRLLTFDTDVLPPRVSGWPASGVARCSLPSPFPLAPGHYPVNIAVLRSGIFADYVQSALALEVVEGDFYQNGRLSRDTPPMFYAGYRWEVSRSE